MVTEFVLVKDEQSKFFSSVLPPDYAAGGDRISIGCYGGDGAVLGAVSFVFIHYQIELDWLFVEPAVRRNGIAKELMDHVIAFASETMEFYPISATYCLGEGVDPVHEFFVSYNKMDVVYSHDRFFLSPCDIAITPYLYKKLMKRLEHKNFFDHPPAVQKYILSSIAKQENYYVGDFETWKKQCVKDLCLCNLAGNTVMDIVLVQRKHDGDFDLSFIYSKYSEGLLCTLISLIRTTELRYPGAKITFDAEKEEEYKLAKKLFPDSQTRQVFEASW